MEKMKVKKCLLYVSLIPYILVAIFSIYHGIFGYEYGYVDRVAYGIDGAITYFNNFWFELITELNYKMVVTISCIVYQIYYLITLKKVKKETQKVSRKVDIKKIFFVVSILCWIAYLMTGVYGYFYGIKAGLFSDTVIYGMQAAIDTLFLVGIIFCYIPVLPITLIYIVIYLVVKIKEKSKKDCVNNK